MTSPVCLSCYKEKTNKISGISQGAAQKRVSTPGVLRKRTFCDQMLVPLAPPIQFEGVQMNVLRSRVNRGLAELFVFTFTRSFAVWARFKYPAHTEVTERPIAIDQTLRPAHS